MVSFLAYVGTVVGNNLSVLTPIFRSFEVIIIIALVILLALYIWRHIRNDRKARAEQAAALQQQQVPQQNQWMQQSQQQQMGTTTVGSVTATNSSGTAIATPTAVDSSLRSGDNHKIITARLGASAIATAAALATPGRNE